jgi:hypothetical protein
MNINSLKYEKMIIQKPKKDLKLPQEDLLREITGNGQLFFPLRDSMRPTTAIR